AAAIIKLGIVVVYDNKIIPVNVIITPGKLYDAKGHTFVIIPGVIITFTGIILLSYTTTIPRSNAEKNVAVATPRR
ncbi:hypothetical protein ACT453_60105, partial [Bacillus sp. D-CC]